MESEFITTRSRVKVKNKWISEQIIVEQPDSYWFHSFGMLALLLIYSVDQVLNDRLHQFLAVIMCVVWISPHIVRIYNMLFVNVWRLNIPIKEIRSVQLDDQFNELEDKVVVTLQSGRKKTYLFRKAEGQAAGFIDAVNTGLKTLSMALG